MSLPFAPTTLQGVLADAVFLCVLIILPLGARWLHAHQVVLARWYDAATTAQERSVLASISNGAVAWVERYGSSPDGQAKFRQAVALVQAWLGARGITVNMTEIQAAIQDAYASMKTSGALAAAGPTVGAAALPKPDPAPVPASK